MYQVLRVPPNKDSYIRVYEIIKAYTNNSIKMLFNDFYNYTDSIYMIGENDSLYVGTAFLGKRLIDKGYIYVLDVITFSDDDLYLKCFDLIRTIIHDKKDKPIIVENVSDKYHSDLIKALRNNGFKKTSISEHDGSYTWKRINGSYEKYTEEQFRHINPVDDRDTVDKMAKLDHDHGSFDPNRLMNIEEKEEKEYIIDQCQKNFDPCMGCQYYNGCFKRGTSLFNSCQYKNNK